ncbi:MAG: cation:proton antiporter [Clostridia bacterium]|nr:cation:proton antiporter [Clostridia bacterium]
MLDKLYEHLQGNQVAVIIISVSLILFLGFFATRITKLLKLPNVTAYVATGIIIGPYCLDLIPTQVVSGMGFISDIALAFISFGIGEFFKIGIVKKNFKSVAIITLMEIAVTSVLIFVLTYFVFNLSLPVSIVLASISFVVSPVSTAMTIRQKNAGGDFVDNLLSVIASGDILGLIAFSIAVSIATGISLGSLNVEEVLLPVGLNLVMIALGAVSGYVLKLLMTAKRSNDNRLIVSIALLFLLCGFGSALGVSPLLACIVMGSVYVNVSGDEKLFKQIRYFSPPILLIYFVKSGLTFNIDALFSSESVTYLPLIAVCLIYILVQTGGKYLGTFLGCKMVKKPAKTCNFFGLALIPQAGIAIGLSELASRSLSGTDGSVVQTIIISVGLICEIFGPVLADFALRKSGSYESEPTVVLPDDSIEKRRELLTKKLNAIKDEIDASNYYRSENEAAFMELESEYIDYNKNKFKNRR